MSRSARHFQRGRQKFLRITAEALGITMGEFREAGKVARAFPENRRHWNVPWQAYAACVDLPEEEQSRLLDYHEIHGCFPER